MKLAYIYIALIQIGLVGCQKDLYAQTPSAHMKSINYDIEIVSIDANLPEEAEDIIERVAAGEPEAVNMALDEMLEALRSFSIDKSYPSYPDEVWEFLGHGSGRFGKSVPEWLPELERDRIRLIEIVEAYDGKSFDPTVLYYYLKKVRHTPELWFIRSGIVFTEGFYERLFEVIPYSEEEFSLETKRLSSFPEILFGAWEDMAALIFPNNFAAELLWDLEKNEAKFVDFPEYKILRNLLRDQVDGKTRTVLMFYS